MVCCARSEVPGVKWRNVFPCNLYCMVGTVSGGKKRKYCTSFCILCPRMYVENVCTIFTGTAKCAPFLSFWQNSSSTISAWQSLFLCSSLTKTGCTSHFQWICWTCDISSHFYFTSSDDSAVTDPYLDCSKDDNGKNAYHLVRNNLFQITWYLAWSIITEATQTVNRYHFSKITLFTDHLNQIFWWKPS